MFIAFSAGLSHSGLAFNNRCMTSAQATELPVEKQLIEKRLADNPTPSMRQFLLIKAAHSDCLLFYRMGDFYELFFEDAVEAAQILDIALTKRGKNGDEEIPMCGVPVHSHEMYLEKLIASGRKVAICEQLETPEEAKKRGGHKAVVKRDVVRIVTPGTITEEALLAPNATHYLAAVAQARGAYSIAWLELSTGAFEVMASSAETLNADLARIAPREVLCTETILALLPDYKERATLQPDSVFEAKKGERLLKMHYETTTLEGFGTLEAADIAACGALLDYVQLTQLEAMPRLDPPSKQQNGLAMVIDAATRRNLELTATLSGSRKGSLLSVIDKTVTGAGGRVLASQLMSPLTDVAQIHARLDAVEYALTQPELRRDLRDTLKACPDMERALSRLCLGRGGPRDMLAIRAGLLAADTIRQRFLLNATHKDALQEQLPELTAQQVEGLGSHATLRQELERALKDEVPMLARDGNFVQAGYQADLDHFRSLRDDAKQLIANMQNDLRDASGIASLKIKFNNVLGYFIEITSTHEKKVPEHFIHRQTTANYLRYTTPELGEIARNIAEAADKAQRLELEIFEQLLCAIRNDAATITLAARSLAGLDVGFALAQLAEQQRYARPSIDGSKAFKVTGGRHPVVEEALRKDAGQAFITNDCDLGEAEHLWVLTGPNMAGKSTFLRQNALITLMAQMGGFVPAESAHIGVVDRLFSRVGAADDLARGQSTFMVEMVETATILNQATDRSLVILDEIGRGTATYDGLSIAWAVVEHIHNQLTCRALFATHYHELTVLEQELSQLACYSMQVKEWKEEIIFLHQVGKGAADRSYGIHVAKLAGLPPRVIERAKGLLGELEGKKQAVTGMSAPELPLFAAAQPSESAAEKKLKAINPDELSPKEALDALYALKAIVTD